MQTTASKKLKWFDHRQARRLALIIALVATFAIVAVTLVLARSGDETEQVSAIIVATQPLSDTLDNDTLSPSVGHREQRDVVRREGLEMPSRKVIVPVAEDPPLPEGWVDPYLTRNNVGQPPSPPAYSE